MGVTGEKAGSVVNVTIAMHALATLRRRNDLAKASSAIGGKLLGSSGGGSFISSPHSSAMR